MAKRGKVQPTLSRSRRKLAEELRPKVVHSSIYLPEAVYEAIRETAFHERVKIHDIIMQGVEMALKKRGYPSVDDLKSGRKR